MARSHGLLIDYDYCTGCIYLRSGLPAGAQPSGRPVAAFKVTEYVMDTPKGLAPSITCRFPPYLCDLCAARTSRGELPACVKHCQASCMRYGPIAELAAEMTRKPRTVIFRPR